MGSKPSGGTSSTGKRTVRGTGIVSSSSSLGAGLTITPEAIPRATGRSTPSTGTYVEGVLLRRHAELAFLASAEPPRAEMISRLDHAQPLCVAAIAPWQP